MLNVQNIVSVSDFRQNMSTWLDKVSKSDSVVLIQNSKPKAVLVDPEYLDYLEKYADGFYDEGDAAELKRIIDNTKQDDLVPFRKEDYL